MLKRRILSSDVCFPTKLEIIDIANSLEALRKKYIVVTNAHNQYLAHKSKEYLKVHEDAYLCLSDSQILNISCFFLYGEKANEVFLGSTIMKIICQNISKNIRVGLYGSSSTTLSELCKNLKILNPDINIKYSVSPPFRELAESEAAETVNQINERKLDILFVGLGCPKQELWMYKNHKKLNCLSIGVGAAFDFNAFPSQEIPAHIHKIGLGALYRLKINPKLLRRYLIDGSKFLYHLCVEKIQLSIKK